MTRPGTLDRWRWWYREIVFGHRVPCVDPTGRRWVVSFRPTFVDGTLPIVERLRAQEERTDRWFTGSWGVLFARWGGMWLLAAECDDAPPVRRFWIVAGSLDAAQANATDLVDRITRGESVEDDG